MSNHINMTPSKFYGIVEVMRQVSVDKQQELTKFIDNMEVIAELLEQQSSELAKTRNNFLQELKLSTRVQQGLFRSLDKQMDDLKDYSHLLSNKNFLLVAFNCFSILSDSQKDLVELARSMRPGELVLSEERFDGAIPSADRLQHMMYEFQLNSPVLTKFTQAMVDCDSAPRFILELSNIIARNLEGYYSALNQRHTIDGVEVFRDAIVTDLAISIYENVDSHGEIEDGKKPDEISAYTIRKAEIIAEAMKNGLTSDLIRDPKQFIKMLQDGLKALWGAAVALRKVFADEIGKIKNLVEQKTKPNPNEYDFESNIDSLNDLDPRNIVYREKHKILTSEERYNRKFTNETLEKIVSMMTDDSVSSQEMIQYILKRKAELKAYFLEENSFYVCKIGNGNPFTGEAPGGLTVVPSERPTADLNNVLGSGFDEIRRFVKTVESSAKWHDLFLATSPSKTTDKSNVLLVGPGGCGKTEILRSVGGDKKSIGIFAQGSDFLTCWKGEAEKNPKRLFETGLRLAKESGKRVNFLIDEIDALLKKQEDVGHGDTNLTLEFQILMDGVVHYPNLSVWGATNYPEKIPMPMLRRFSSVVIVGELSQDDRVKLLRQFVSFLPTAEFGDVAWESCAARLEGATGDVIRKIADHIWRAKMTEFVNRDSTQAEELVRWLNQEEKFRLADFDDKRKFNFRQKLGKHVQVRPKDLDESISLHLQNIAVRSEIESAKETYAKAKKILRQLV